MALQWFNITDNKDLALQSEAQSICTTALNFEEMIDEWVKGSQSLRFTSGTPDENYPNGSICCVFETDREEIGWGEMSLEEFYKLNPKVVPISEALGHGQKRGLFEPETQKWFNDMDKRNQIYFNGDYCVSSGDLSAAVKTIYSYIAVSEYGEASVSEYSKESIEDWFVCDPTLSESHPSGRVLCVHFTYQNTENGNGFGSSVTLFPDDRTYVEKARLSSLGV